MDAESPLASSRIFPKKIYAEMGSRFVGYKF